MERNKCTSSRSQKKAGAHAGNEFFALGTKSNRDESKAKILTIKSSSSERKREAPTVLLNVAKKTKVGSSRFSNEMASTSNVNSDVWDPLVAECDVQDLLETVSLVIELQDNDNIYRVLSGWVRQLTVTIGRSKHDSLVLFLLIYLAKIKPALFQNDLLTKALISTLRRETNLKSRLNVQSHIFASNILAKSFSDKQNWPEQFLRCYIEDAINERVWSDNELCAPFVENICSSFKTRTPPQNLLIPEIASSVGTPTVVTLGMDDDSGDNSSHGVDLISTGYQSNEILFDVLGSIRDRFMENDRLVEKYVADAIKDQLNKRQQQESYTRNLLKFLCTTCGLPEVRFLCVSRLELWIPNGKLIKFAQQLLSYLTYNINSKCYKDHEVLAILVKMRLKTKPLINHYMNCLKEIILAQPDVLSVLLKLVVQNELSNTRNPNNMVMLATMFQSAPDQSASFLAEIYQEFLLQREDCIRTLRVFLRELVRILRFEFNIVQFCKAFLKKRQEITSAIEQSEFRERIFQSMVDIICLCMLLTVSPQVREALLSIRTSRDTKSCSMLIKFYNQMSQLQLDTVSWMYDTVPNLFKLQCNDYHQALQKLLLLENPDQYSRCDQWPSEPERATLLRMISETPIHEETLLRIILIGITKEIQFSIADTFETVMLVLKRASAMRFTSVPAIQVNKFDIIIDFLFSMSEYHHPEKIKLPIEYDPPKLAIIVLYWKAWLILIVISAHNPSTFGAFCWDHYPTMKMLMEMCITNQFNENLFPKEELQILPIERQTILEFETYLAAQTSQAVITEENAILISQLMLMNPMGPARKPTATVLDQIRCLNNTYKLGHLLCRSRKPDLLLDIIQRHGTTQSMPWLSDLVQNSDGDFNHLPAQCLCEFLLFNANLINEENSRDAQLVDFLRNLLVNPETNKQTVCEVLDYIFRRLSSTAKQSRVSALLGLKIVLKSSETDDNEWLLRSIPQTPHFLDVRCFIIPQLRAACQVENSPDLVMSYIQFIAAHTLNDSVNDMLDHVIDMAQLIVERSTMFQHIIPTIEDFESSEPNSFMKENRVQTLKCLFVMFNNYIIKLREYNEPYEWTECPDLLMVQFDDGVQLPLHINIIHAFIILLTQSTSTMVESLPILDYWFPIGRPPPTAFLPNIPHEPVQLLPDWLKLKMIRSPVDRLIDAALQELTADQIVLFVQNFGTPVNSMSKLLALLDHAVNEQFDAVKNAILNKAYLAQLIEIQQARGAKNGHFTVQQLELYSHFPTIADYTGHKKQETDHTQMSQLYSVQHIPSSKTDKMCDNVDETIQAIFKSPKLNPITNKKRFHMLIHQLLKHFDKNSNDYHYEFIVNEVINNLKRKDDCQKQTYFYSSFGENAHICTFFRALLSFEPNNEYKMLYYRIIKETNEPLNTSNKGIYTNNYTNLIQILQKSQSTEAALSTALFKEIPSQKTKLDKMLYEFESIQIRSKTNSTELTKYVEIEKSLDYELLCENGLLVDWLAEIDPDIVSMNRKAELNFLFSESCSNFRFYLLSLICHQSSWRIINSTLEYLLRKPCKVFDCSIVLNFIEALTNNPKLWQGQDKCIPKESPQEEIFLIKQHEVPVFCDYIMCEGAQKIENFTKITDYKLCSRINLFFTITHKNPRLLATFVEFVLKSSYTKQLKLRVLQQIYLMYPSIKFIDFGIPFEYISKLQTLKGCQADKVSSYLITCLGSLFLKKDFETLSSDIELLIRKLAASHPELFLRQLGVLSSLIEGRSQITSRALRDEYHFHRFIQILRTLEVLQPMLFDDVYKNELQTSLKCYFIFFKHHSFIKEAYHILIKFVELLQAYINNNPTSAYGFLEHYVCILMELSVKFSNVTSLQQLVQTIALLQHKTISTIELSVADEKNEMETEDQTDIKNHDTELSETPNSATIAQIDLNSRGSISSATFNCQNFISPHVSNLIKIIRQSSSEDIILGPLQEIESLTSKKFTFLNGLFERLLELIFSPSAQVRSNAFILLIRHLKHNPGRLNVNQTIFNTYIQCLRDENSSVAATAIDNLPELSLLLQEYAVEILAVAFSLGVRSRLNTNIQIKRVLQTLLLQHGF